MPRTSHERALYQLIKEIRGAFNELKALSDRMNADLDVTAAMRAVLETLCTNGAATVPDIARAKSVSRQHIQILADTLVSKGLARSVENPAHQRSRLLEITAEGRTRFNEVTQRETAALADLEKLIGTQEAAGAAKAVQKLRSAIRELK
ncbi:MAG: hypothetical protein WBH14_05745 [Albidovulum sp.]